MRSLPCIAMFPVLLVIASCTVKENRIVCPVCLHFERIGNPYECAGEVEVYGFTGQDAAPDFLKKDNIGAFLSGADSVLLSKRAGRVTMLASGGATAGRVSSGYEYRIPEGEQMDCIYALNDRFEVMDDDYYVRGSLLRQFAGVTLRIAGMDGRPCQFDVSVHGSSSGFDLNTLSPVNGRLVLHPGIGSDGTYRFRLPRQEDGWELSLSLYVAGNAEPLHETDLSDCFRRAGYDWTAADLEEVELNVDYARGTVDVTVGNWSNVVDIDIDL